MPRRRRLLLGISPTATKPSTRGFNTSNPVATARLEAVGSTFALGYNAALEEASVEPLIARLQRVPIELRGWAFEGAAMGLALCDFLAPWRKPRWPALLEGPGDDHLYLILVGVGWALSKLKRRVRELPAGLDPLYGWLAIDGYGFCEGFFDPRHYFGQHRAPKRVAGYATRAFDQGLGRCLWFAEGCAVDAVARCLAGFDPARQADLWSGLGLAACFAEQQPAPIVQRWRRALPSQPRPGRGPEARSSRPRSLARCCVEQQPLWLPAEPSGLWKQCSRRK